jgi:Domain of unknown function (DUF4399)
VTAATQFFGLCINNALKSCINVSNNAALTKLCVHSGTGHFHLLIDADEDYPLGKAIPFDATHLHYGKGQTSASIELPTGSHKLALQFANALHESYGPEYLKTIKVTVE